jgi:hypothetical protein
MVENARKRMAGKKVEGESPDERKTNRRKKNSDRKELRKEYRGKKRAHRAQKRNQRQGRATTMQHHDPGKWSKYKNRKPGADVLRSKYHD